MATAPHLQMDSSDVEHERVMYMYTFSLHLSIPQKQKKKKARTHQILESISIYPPSSILLFCFARAVLCYFFFFLVLFSNEIIPNSVSAQTFFNP